MALTLMWLVVIANSWTSVAQDEEPQNVGKSFFLWQRDILQPSSLRGGYYEVFSRNDDSCWDRSPTSEQQWFTNGYSSYHSLVTSTKIFGSAAGDYPTQSMLVKASLDFTKTKETSEKQTFKSAFSQVHKIVNVVDLNTRESECVTIQDGVIESALSLPFFYHNDDVMDYEGKWKQYIHFLEAHGSHIMTQKKEGAIYRHWEHTSDESEGSTDLLKVKACIAVEDNVDNKKEIHGCAGINEHIKEEARKMSSSSKDYAVGGSSTFNTKMMSGSFNNEDLDGFLASADENHEGLYYSWKPIWRYMMDMVEVTNPISEQLGLQCDYANWKDHKTERGCRLYQRALNLQAAWEMILVSQCKYETAPGFDQVVLRKPRMQHSPEGEEHDSDGHAAHSEWWDDHPNIYECIVPRTGCYSSDDCAERGWVYESCPTCADGKQDSACSCTGAACFDIDVNNPLYEDPSDPSQNVYFTKQVLNVESDALRANGACTRRFGIHPWTCYCDPDYDLNIGERVIYTQQSVTNSFGRSLDKSSTTSPTLRTTSPTSSSLPLPWWIVVCLVVSVAGLGLSVAVAGIVGFFLGRSSSKGQPLVGAE